ncbi:MAG: DUF374 domain-containing protein [Hyphomonadaceae bacterium]|nr:DUF374 domain-containing protein [Hyphomonadaceae bacterium]
MRAQFGHLGKVWCGVIGIRASWVPIRFGPKMFKNADADFAFSETALFGGARGRALLGRMVVRGSSSKKKKDGEVEDKGALQAFRQMVAHAQKGGCVGITPDGPKGPRMRAQIGAVRVAKIAKVPLLPSALRWRGQAMPRVGTDFIFRPYSVVA